MGPHGQMDPRNKMGHSGLCDALDGTQKQHMRATWIEFLVALQDHAGFRLRVERDLASAERAIRTGWRRPMDNASLSIKGSKTTTKQAWNMAPSINSLKYIIGCIRAGVLDRV